MLAFYYQRSEIIVLVFTNTQSRFEPVVLDSNLGPLRPARDTYNLAFIATLKMISKPLMGAVSAQKALQGSETETR